MDNWREIEPKLIDAFRQLGLRPKMCADFPYSHRANGEWYVTVMNELNLTELARLLERRL